jgi:two-component system, sensor histidine kinase and response regulator
LYATLLEAFATEMVDTPDQLHTQLAAHDIPHAARTLHTLKGLAATVGARHLSQVAAQLEKAVKDESEPYDADAMVQTVREAIDALTQTLVPGLEKLQEGAQPVNASTTDSAALNPAQLKQDVQTLLRLLESSDMVAIDVFAMIEQTFGPSLKDALNPLRTAMNNLDFAGAAIHCQALLRTHH